jgi:hypothetical protein
MSLSERKILSARKIASEPDAGSKAIATIEKSKTFQPLLKKPSRYTYSLSEISITKTARIILSIKRRVFPNELIIAEEVSIPIVMELKTIKLIIVF